MNRGAWKAAVHRARKRQKQLKQLSKNTGAMLLESLSLNEREDPTVLGNQLRPSIPLISSYVEKVFSFLTLAGSRKSTSPNLTDT